MRVEADEDEATAGREQPRRLGVERPQVGEVLVDQAGDDEVVGAGVEPGRADLGLADRAVDAPGARRREHRRREVDPVDLPHAPRCQPSPGPPRPATEICRSTDGSPADVEPLEQRQIHRVLDRLLISRRPAVIPLPRPPRSGSRVGRMRKTSSSTQVFTPRRSHREPRFPSGFRLALVVGHEGLDREKPKRGDDVDRIEGPQLRLEEHSGPPKVGRLDGI